jgi:hypothetical protein
MGQPASSTLRRSVRQLEEALAEGSGVPQTHHNFAPMRALMRSTRTSPHERTSQLAPTMTNPARDITIWLQLDQGVSLP